jgi:MarR family transcriptional regulator, organic hydroperoxide resistance regulator
VPTVTLAAPPPATGDAERLTRENLGFLLAKASQRWNDVLGQRFAAAGYPEVRPAYGSLLIPLFEEDGLRQGELARRARLSKQTMTTMARALEQAGLVERRGDPEDGRATRLYLTARARAFRPVAAEILADLDERAAARLRIGRSTLESALRSLLEL